MTKSGTNIHFYLPSSSFSLSDFQTLSQVGTQVSTCAALVCLVGLLSMMGLVGLVSMDWWAWRVLLLLWIWTQLATQVHLP